MDFLGIAVSAVVAWIAATTSRMLASEFEGRFEKLGRYIIERAYRRLPEHNHARYREEWLAHFDECPSLISKFYHAVQCHFSVRSLTGVSINWLNEKVQTIEFEVPGAGAIVVDPTVGIHGIALLKQMHLKLSVGCGSLPRDEGDRQLAALEELLQRSEAPTSTQHEQLATLVNKLPCDMRKEIIINANGHRITVFRFALCEDCNSLLNSSLTAGQDLLSSSHCPNCRAFKSKLN
jgi:hypothetical protein